MHRTLALAALMCALTAAAQPFSQSCDQIDAQGCRTVAIVGDTQDIADYETRIGSQFPRKAWLTAMINWILANRDAENIDFVLQVGDITEHGWWLPMSPTCANACNAADCHCPAEVAAEWNVFTSEFQRLEAAGIPFALVPGNHDNIKSLGGALDGPGFDDYYSPAHLAALPGYLESRTSAASGCTATAWRFSLGTQPVIVLGFPDSSMNPPSATRPDGSTAVDRCPGTDPELDDWANALIERPQHLGAQVILLHHRLLEGDLTRRARWLNTISRRPERYIAGVSGHWSPAEFPFSIERHSQTGSRLEVFAPRVNWQDVPLPGRLQPTAASSLLVVRFRLGAQPTRLEARAWSEYYQVADGVTNALDYAIYDDGVPLRDYSILHDRDPDPCPYYSGPSPLDSDGDGRGDACECGDQSGDGRNDVQDLIAINRAIFSPALATPLCDANGDGRCNVSDLIAANAEIFTYASTSTCASQPVPGPIP